MNVYKTGDIRNVILMGHGGSGKSTLAESMAYSTGIISRMGNITDGNTISDFDKEEIKRKFSINSTIIPIEFDGVKINLYAVIIIEMNSIVDKPFQKCRCRYIQTFHRDVFSHLILQCAENGHVQLTKDGVI